MKSLSSKQQKIYNFMKLFMKENNYPPTYREIAGHFGDNIGTVQVAIGGLVKKGYLIKGNGIARGFTLTHIDEDTELMRLKSSFNAIPLYGNVAAGEPVFADSNLQGYIPFPVLKGNAEGIFCLRVIGDSMIERGIFENDILFVRRQSVAEDGEIVVALLEDEATVKIFRRDKSKVYLKPANSRYNIITKPFKIIGKVISMKRDYSII